MDISISHDALKDTMLSLGNPFDEMDSRGYNVGLLAHIGHYLCSLGSETIIVEKDYVDSHFIEDFCGHYGRCFVSYNRKCVRLHFFNGYFTEDEFKSILLTEEETPDTQTTLGQYLGYIVLRPIPASFFAKVCLAFPYDLIPEAKLILKPYVTHLCGLTFRVRTVAFQEQDHAISACATVALWMGFNAAPGISPRDVPSPYEINEIVRRHQVDGQLTHLVGKGLNVAQISSVITEHDFETLAIRPQSFGYAKAVISAYLSMDIPIVLGIDLNRKTSESSVGASLGKHAVTIIGYGGQQALPPFRENLHKKDNTGIEGIDLYLESSAIRDLIVHDDQTGPFSKMTITDEYGQVLETEWMDSTSNGEVDAFIEVLMVMNVPKVRIRFSSMLEITKELNGLLFPIYRDAGFYISWDIRLINVCTLKREIRMLSPQKIGSEDRLRVLTQSYPRYMWAIDMLVRENNEYEGAAEMVSTFYFDATDMENAGFFLFGLNYDAIGWITKAVFETIDMGTVPLSLITRQIQQGYVEADPSKGNGLIIPTHSN